MGAQPVPGDKTDKVSCVQTVYSHASSTGPSVSVCVQWQNAWNHIPSSYALVWGTYDQLHPTAGHWQHAWVWHIHNGCDFARNNNLKKCNVLDFWIKGFQISKDASANFVSSSVTMCFIPQKKTKSILLFISRAFVYCEVVQSQLALVVKRPDFTYWQYCRILCMSNVDIRNDSCERLRALSMFFSAWARSFCSMWSS